MIEVYHGSTICVKNPMATICRDNLDFGKGFYITSFQQQAESWAERVAVNAGRDAIFNIYDFDIDAVRAHYRVLTFTDYDDPWLDFISLSRHGEHPWQDYDMIEGGVANDRVFNTVELYLNEFIPKEEALKRLRYEKPNNQFCLINQSLIDTCLHFREATPLTNK